MAKDKYGKKGKGMLAPESEIVVKQQMSAPTRYSGMLAPSSEIEIKQAQNYKDSRY